MSRPPPLKTASITVRDWPNSKESNKNVINKTLHDSHKKIENYFCEPNTQYSDPESYTEYLEDLLRENKTLEAPTEQSRSDIRSKTDLIKMSKGAIEKEKDHTKLFKLGQ